KQVHGTLAEVDSSAVVLTPAQNALIQNRAFAHLAPGQTGATVQTDGLTGVFEQPSGGDGGTTLFLGTYADDPQSGATESGVFYEVKVSRPAADASLQLVFRYA